MNKRIALLLCILFIPFSAFSQNQDEITKAFNEHNCGVLYDFIQDKKDKDPKLITNAAYIINRYAMPDSSVHHYKKSIMHARVWKVDKSLTDNVFQDPQKYLPLVVAQLTQDVKDSFLKVKILHDWICYYIAYDVDTFFGKSRSNQDYISVIKNKKAICGGYAALFNEMCKLASVESIVITGPAKGYSYDENKGVFLDHAWNAVKIIGRWYLLDVTWDVGYVEGQSFIRSYSTHYLFLDPYIFINEHLPAEHKFQFYAPVMTKEQFEKDKSYKYQIIKRTRIEKIAIAMYEQKIVPALDILLEKKRITKNEKNYFMKAYTKIPENGYYYFIEDQFAIERNNAVSRIRPLIDNLIKRNVQ